MLTRLLIKSTFVVVPSLSYVWLIATPLQHTRLPCPSPFPNICSNSCPLNQRSYLTSLSLLPPSPPALNLSQHQGLFQWVSSASGGQSIGASVSAPVLPMNIQGWFPLGLTGLISLLSKGPSRVFSSTTIWKHQFLSAQTLWSNSHICTWVLEYLWLYAPLLATDVSAFPYAV